MSKAPSKAPAQPKYNSLDDIFGSPAKIPNDVQAELDEKGLEGRWINWQKYQSYGGTHRRGWVPFKSESRAKFANPILGDDSNGYIRRESLVLAARPKELGDKHREYLRERAQMLNPGRAAKEARDELQQRIKDQGLEKSARILGYSDE